MNEIKGGFQFWPNYYRAANSATDPKAFTYAIAQYFYEGIVPTFTNDTDNLLWDLIFPSIRCSKRQSDRGGGAPEGNRNNKSGVNQYGNPKDNPKVNPKVNPKDNQLEIEKEIEKESSKNSKNLPSDFDFKSSLISLGVSGDVAAKFMAVRNSNGARNTLHEFNKIADEIKKANAGGVMANECIQMSVENQWQGFKYEWYLRKVKPIGERKTERHNEQEEEFFKIATEQHMLKAIANKIGKNETDTYQLLDSFDVSCLMGDVGHQDFDHYLRHFEKKVREGKVTVFTRVS